MKATGIVRRMDALGQVAIPREIRRELGFKDGAPLEIFIQNENELVLKKYVFPMEEEDWA